MAPSPRGAAEIVCGPCLVLGLGHTRGNELLPRESRSARSVSGLVAAGAETEALGPSQGFCGRGPRGRFGLPLSAPGLLEEWLGRVCIPVQHICQGQRSSAHLWASCSYPSVGTRRRFHVMAGLVRIRCIGGRPIGFPTASLGFSLSLHAWEKAGLPRGTAVSGSLAVGESRLRSRWTLSEGSSCQWVRGCGNIRSKGEGCPGVKKEQREQSVQGFPGRTQWGGGLGGWQGPGPGRWFRRCGAADSGSGPCADSDEGGAGWGRPCCRASRCRRRAAL